MREEKKYWNKKPVWSTVVKISGCFNMKSLPIYALVDYLPSHSITKRQHMSRIILLDLFKKCTRVIRSDLVFHIITTFQHFLLKRNLKIKIRLIKCILVNWKVLLGRFDKNSLKAILQNVDYIFRIRSAIFVKRKYKNGYICICLIVNCNNHLINSIVNNCTDLNSLHSLLAKFLLLWLNGSGT